MTEAARQMPAIGIKAGQWRGVAFFLFVVSFIAWLLLATVNWMTDENRLPLSQLVIQGELTYLTPNDVRAAIVQSEQLGSFMTQDIDDIQRALLSLPWVAQASVRKQWPDTLKVFVIEHRPEAVWNQEALLNSQGQVFNAQPESVTGLGLANLSGPDDLSEQVLSAYQAMQQQLSALGFKIEYLTLNERRAWRLWLDNGIRLELGREAWLERLERFVWLFPDLTQQDKVIDYVDLRYDTGTAVGWKTIQE